MRFNEWCDKNKLGYKILLADNVKNVNRLKRMINSTGIQVINLEGCRMIDLARRIVIEHYAQDRKLQNIEVVNPDFSVLLIYKLLNNENTNKYDFIPKEKEVRFDNSRRSLFICGYICRGRGGRFNR